MAAAIKEISDSNFETEVLTADKPVLIDFWAPWCGPCKAIAPVVEALAEVYDQKVIFAKCNVDDNPQIPGKYGIKSIPTLLFFKDGQLADQITGMVGRGKLEKSIDTILAGGAGASPFMMK